MHIHLEPSPDSQRNLYQIKNKKNRTVIPPPTANHVVEFSVWASFLYLADIMERFCDLLSNSVKETSDVSRISYHDMFL